MRRELDAAKSLQRYVASVLPPPWDVRRVVEAGAMPPRPYALVTRNGSLSSGGRRDVFEITEPMTVHLYPEPRDTREESEDYELELRELLLTLVEVGTGAGHHRRIPLYSYVHRDAIQRVHVTAQGGTYRLRSPGGAWTPDLPYTANGVAVEAPLAATGLPVRVLRRGPRLYDVHYETAGVDEPLLEGDPAGLLGGTAPAELAISHLLRGAPAPWRSERDFMRVSADPSINTVRDAADPRVMMVALDVRCTFARSQPIPSDSTLLTSYRLRFEGMR